MLMLKRTLEDNVSCYFQDDTTSDPLRLPDLVAVLLSLEGHPIHE